MENDKNLPSARSVNNAAIAGISIYTAICYFQFELGICNHYGIPKSLIQPDLMAIAGLASFILIQFIVVKLWPQCYVTLFYSLAKTSKKIAPFLRVEIVMFALTIGVVWLCYFAGNKVAERKKDYKVSTEYNYILLKQYGDKLIMRSYNPVTKKSGDNLIVASIHGTRQYKFKAIKTSL